jgi:hypothetical protein
LGAGGGDAATAAAAGNKLEQPAIALFETVSSR